MAMGAWVFQQVGGARKAHGRTRHLVPFTCVPHHVYRRPLENMEMKVRPEHYLHMRDAILAISDRIPEMRAAISRDPRVKDAEMRLRWDCFSAAGLTGWACRSVYSYADDTHIDTALRGIMREVGARARPENDIGAEVGPPMR